MARKGERVYNVMLDDEEFFRIRNEEVLPQWKTGKQIENFEETVESSRQDHAQRLPHRGLWPGGPS